MAKLSETFTYNGGGKSTAPSIPQLQKQNTQPKLSESFSYNNTSNNVKPKLSETFSYDIEVPHNEPKITPLPTVKENKAGLFSGLSNLMTGNLPMANIGVGNTNSSMLMDKAINKANTKAYQQNIRNQELADFDSKDTSNVVYNSPKGFKVTQNKIDLWLDPSYKLSDDERKQIKSVVNDMTDVRNYQKYFGNMSIEDGATLRQKIGELEARTKGAFGRGFAEAIPGVKFAENTAAKLLDNANGDNHVSEGLARESAMLQGEKAYNVGKAVSKIGQYTALNKSGLLDPINSRLSKFLVPKLGEAFGGHVANILSDEVADILLDTLPETYDNIKSGMSAKEVGNEVLKNLGINLAYNVGGEAIPSVIQAFRAKGKEITPEVAEAIVENADDISEAVAKQVSNGPTEIEKEAEALRKARTVEEVPAVELPQATKEVVQEELPTLKAVSSKKILSDNTFASTINSLKHSFDGKVKYIKDTENEYAKAFKAALDNFSSKPTKASYSKAINALDNYVENSGTAWKKNYNGEWYEKTFDDKGIRSTLEQIGTKYNLNNTGLPKLPEANQKNLVMAEDAGINDEVSELVAPVEIKADAPRVPDTELPPLEAESGPVSRFWEGGTMETVTDPKVYDEAYKPMEDYNRILQKPDDYVSEVSDARLFTNGAIDPKKVDDWRKALSAAENISKEDIATAMDIKAYLEANNMLEESADFMSRIRPHITNDAQVLQYLGSLKKNTIAGQLEQALADVRRATDKKVGKKGFTDAVNNFARQVEDAIENGNLDSVGGMFKKKLSDYAYGSNAKNVLRKTNIDGEQMVLDLIGGYEPNKKTLKELAEEVGANIRRLNKVADITSKDEASVFRILQDASQYEVDTRAFKELFAKAAKVLDNKIPVSLGDKIKTTLYDNMLGNFKTAVTRNAGGNLISNTLEKVQKPLKVAIDKAIGSITGERNYILDKSVAKSYGEGFKKGLKDQALDFVRGTNTIRSGEESFADALANVKSAYKGSNGLSKMLGAYDRVVKSAMQFGDRPFYEAEFAAAKTELEKIVEKYGKDALTQVGVPEEALESIDKTIEFLARSRALEACFQKGTISAEGFRQLKDGLGNVSRGVVGADVVSQFSMPFIQVPANMMERMADYIPGLGTVKNIAQTIGEAKFGGGLNQRRLVDATSRNLTGLGLFAGGVALANNAANGGAGITGGYSEDYDKSDAQKSAGEQEYAVQLPNGYQVDISDLPTLGPMAQASSRFAEALRNNDNLAEGITEGGKQALSAAFETSALQGLNRMFGTSQYGGGNSLGENVMNVLGSGLGQAVPSLVRQGAQVADPYTRYLGEYNTIPYFLNNVVNSTPARIPALQPKLDNEGNIVEQNQGRNVGMKILENMVLPWKITKPEYTKLGETANQIFENSSDNTAKAYPTVPLRADVRKWKGDSYTDNDYYNVKERAGKLNTLIGNAVIDSDFFKGLSADEQANVMQEIYSGIKAIVREENEKGYTTDNAIVKAYKQNKSTGVVNYLSDKYTLHKFKSEAAGLRPDGSPDSMDKDELAVYLYMQGYSLDDINNWVIKNGAKNGFTKTQLDKLIRESDSWK